MAIVMSNGDGIFRAQMNNRNWAGKISQRRRLQIIAAGQGLGTLAAVFVLGALALSGVQAVADQSEKMVLNPAVPMSVGQGETLWMLAKRYGNPSASQLDRVDTLAKANGLSASAMLHPGQRLVVPIENPQEAERLQTVMAAR